MWIRRRPPPSDVQSSSTSHSHGCSSSSSKQDPLMVDESVAMIDVKKVKKPSSTLRKNGCNPTSEMSAGDSSTSSSATFQGHWLEEDKVLPQKKRRITFESDSRNATEEKTEFEKVNATTARRKRVNSKRVVESDDDYELGDEMVCTQKINKSVITDSMRCRRSDGRGWRCCKPAVEGHSMCEHHLHKTRAANKLRVREKKSSKSLTNGQKANHKVKTRHEIESPFPQSDVKSCFSNPKSKGSSTLIRMTQRCNRWNGKEWRCSEPAFEGHSLCEHHISGNRRRNDREKIL